MAHGLDAGPITLCQEAFLTVAQGASDTPKTGHDAWRAIAANHRFICLLWREVDKARRQDVAPAKSPPASAASTATTSSATTPLNRSTKRLSRRWGTVMPVPGARLSSETAVP